ncbi:MAG: ATP-sensitive inward rectifier potassium channel 10 [Candidatus Omnitrophica bacterium]|nr:ATP-sensitive inward rectifier potassium channel 10 [Candidatus Omnitrophota bacterium]
MENSKNKKETIIGSSSTPTVINKDGSLNIHRPREFGRLFSDLYHYFLSISWPKFFLILFTLFFAANVFFGVLYFAAGPDALQGVDRDHPFLHFVDCFFFSVQLFDSAFTPSGIWINILVTVQNYLGLLMIVIITGLLYARFARPSARVIFSEWALISMYNGKPCLSFRVANERLNHIVEAHMTLTLTRNEESLEGEKSRKFHNLKLEVDYSPLFALSWTLRHFIDETSPLYGADMQKLENDGVVIFASLSGIDDTFSQTITARNVYRYDEIIFNKRFKDILLWDKNKMHINLKGISDVQ